jgi:hypothetical protein
MYIPKKYGQSKIDRCPFCAQQATTVNAQSVPVCTKHKNKLLENLKCLCGEYLDIKTGKYGVFFNCMNCGNMNLKKVLEINDVEEKAEVKKKPKEITIDTNDPNYF